jgi:uncharacterized protein YutE (UPF0331/DUF86 family)
MSNTYTYTVTLTEEENDALAYVAYSQQDWIDNAVHHRCKLAVEEVLDICIKAAIANAVQLPVSKEDIINLGYEQGWLKTAEQRELEAQARMAELAQKNT